ncbi:hypothetical protein E4417_13045 [Stenotrophomonas maltophilia]|uniref:hypothetical protein n=1 Tax=Stenotrophomonas maltophilia TaxID=40324 RepID=UPI0010942436|nr:hypothetical protein [Stenotrophomonas maltophilia]TGW17578.1 hypothetical protein E4417_13045 [Stenotrophomonas maltophilia]
MKPRHRADVPGQLISITDQQHSTIKRLAILKQIEWSQKVGEHVEVIAKFREEMKEHYFNAQRRRCCYCSIELHDHKLTYDAEHILDKSDYLEYMFDPGNLAAACKLCNGSKSNMPIASSGARFVELSRCSEDYTIVHPHLDEWGEHLGFDVIDRIVARDGSAKGRETIRICGIQVLNAARLADEFSLDDRNDAESVLRSFHEEPNLSKKKELVALLRIMAGRYAHAGSTAVVDALADDVARLESIE